MFANPDPGKYGYKLYGVQDVLSILRNAPTDALEVQSKWRSEAVKSNDLDKPDGNPRIMQELFCLHDRNLFKVEHGRSKNRVSTPDE